MMTSCALAIGEKGAFFGANALVTKPAQSLALFLTAFILKQIGFVTRAMNFGQIFLDLIPIRAVWYPRDHGIDPRLGQADGCCDRVFLPAARRASDRIEAEDHGRAF
jgi:hypothetical protein